MEIRDSRSLAGNHASPGFSMPDAELGDTLVVAFVVNDSISPTMLDGAKPSGLTEDLSISERYTPHIRMFTRVIDGSEPAEYTWSLGAANSIGLWAGTIPNAVPEISGATAARPGSGSSMTFPGGESGIRILAGGAQNWGPEDIGQDVWDSGVTELLDDGNDWLKPFVATTESEGDLTATFKPGNFSNGWAAASIVLQPKAEDPPPATEPVRYNRVPRPWFGSGWKTSRTRAALRQIMSTRGDGTSGYIGDAYTSGTSSSVIQNTATDGMAAVSPGKEYTASIYVYQGSGVTKNIRVDIDNTNSAGGWVSTWNGAGKTVAVRNATWTRVEQTAVIPDGVAYLDIFSFFDIRRDNTYIAVSCPMVEDGPSSPNYRDGGYSGWEWTGTAGASPSRSVITVGANPPPGYVFFIDISNYQAGIDLPRIKSLGYSGCIAKIGQGAGTRGNGGTYGSTLDDSWPSHRDRSLALWPKAFAGYWYLGNTEPPASQAQRCANYIGNKKIPVMLDWEDAGGNWANFLACLEAFRRAGLFVTLLYTSRGYAGANGAENIDATGLNVIQARYWSNVQGPPRVLWDEQPVGFGYEPFNGASTDAHQFTQYGEVHAGRVIDVNSFPGTAAELGTMLHTGPPPLKSSDLPGRFLIHG